MTLTVRGNTTIKGQTTVGFSPASLFAQGEQGVWYEPSDLSTLFQDSAGTIPVTAVEQPVGLMLDKRMGRGNNVCDTSTLVLDPGWTYSGGKLTGTNVASGNAAYRNVLASSTPYLVTLVIDSISSGSVQVYFGGNGTSSNLTTAGTYTFFFISGTSNQWVGVKSTTATTNVVISSLSYQQTSPNYASQSTAAARPVLSARVNLLTYTEDFSNAAWAKGFVDTGVTPTVTANQGSAPDGTNTADLVVIDRTDATGIAYVTQRISIAAGQYTGGLYVKAYAAGDVGKQIAIWQYAGGVKNIALYTLTTAWQRITVGTASNLGSFANGEPTAFGYMRSADGGGTQTGSVSFLAWGADGRPSNSGVGLPAYQRVNTSTDYDTTGFPFYLRFDGVDDGMATGNIDLTSTKQATQIIGFRKTRDTAFGPLNEFGNWFTNVNGFGAWAPASAASNLGLGLLDTSGKYPSNFYTTYAAPISAVMSGAFDRTQSTIATQIVGRINGASVSASSTQSSVIANTPFGNLPLYIGSRVADSLYFSGNVYSLIVRGAASTAQQIAATESYVNKLTKAY